MSFLSDFETQISTAFTNVVDPIASSVASAFQPVFVAGFSIWVLMIAYDVAWGKTEDGLTYLLTKIGKMFMIGVVALYGWGSLKEFASELQQLFVAAVSCAAGQCAGTISSALETNLLNPLYAGWTDLWDSAVATMATLSWLAPITFFTSLLMIIASLVVFGVLTAAVGLLAIVSLVMYMVAFASFELLLSLGPFFLMCLGFPVVQRFFESWVGAVVTSILAMSMTAAMSVFTSSALGLSSLGADMTNADLTTYAAIISMAGKFGFSLLLIYLYYKVFDLAASLGGGMNLGNNILGATRAIARDLNRGGLGGPGRGSNAMSSGAAPAGASAAAGGRGAGGSARAAARNHTLTGMAVSGIAGASISSGRLAYRLGAAGAAGTRRASVAAGQAAVSVGRAAAIGAVRVGRYAYARGASALGIRK